MKKLGLFLLATVIIFGVVGCEKTDSDQSGSKSTEELTADSNSYFSDEYKIDNLVYAKVDGDKAFEMIKNNEDVYVFVGRPT